MRRRVGRFAQIDGGKASPDRRIRSGGDVDGNRAVRTIGESALTGWRGWLGRAAARPIAKRTRFSERQVRTWIGVAVFAYLLYRFLRPTIRAIKAAD